MCHSEYTDVLTTLCVQQRFDFTKPQVHFWYIAAVMLSCVVGLIQSVSLFFPPEFLSSPKLCPVFHSVRVV